MSPSPHLPASAATRPPAPGLLGLGILQRLAIAAVAIVLLWLCVLWALN